MNVLMLCWYVCIVVVYVLIKENVLMFLFICDCFCFCERRVVGLECKKESKVFGESYVYMLV